MNALSTIGNATRTLRCATSARLAATALMAAIGATGCANIAGLHSHAELTDPGTLTASRALRAEAVSDAAWPSEAWWESFGDPQLNRLVANAMGGHPTLGVASARVRQAQAMAGGAESALVPQVGIAARTQRQRYSENAVTPRPVAGSWQWVSDWQVGVGYELDFWGKNRAALDAAIGRARAAEVDYQAAKLMLSAALVRTYLKLDAALAQRDLVEQTYHQREKALELTRRRVTAQVSSRLDMKQAEAALPATRETLLQIDATIAVTRNQLAALQGQGPDAGAHIRRPQVSVAQDAAIPSSLPAELVGRRPDLVAQRWRVEAAAQDIKVARAQFYPNVSLTAFAGLQSIRLSDLLDVGSRALGVGPAISLPIFDGGRLRANLGVRHADYDAAVEQYNTTLLNAVHDVVDQLVLLRSVQHRMTEHRQALTLNEEAYDMAIARYRSGVGNYLEVLSAEGQVLQQRQGLIDLDSQQHLLHLELIRALGGGFAATMPELPAPTHTSNQASQS